MGSMTIRIPISKPLLGPEVEDLVVSVLRSGNLAQGPLVERLEDDFSKLIQVEHVVAVTNGTLALEAALRVGGIGPGDEVITTPFTFVATINAILATGALVRLVDINYQDFNIDPTHVGAAVNRKTRCLLPVHLYGQMADMASLNDLAVKNDLLVVEDAAQSHAAQINGISAGAWGTGCFSLYATKNLTSGEGGLIATNDADTAHRLRLYRNHGMVERYNYQAVGTNLRMTDLQAAVCIPQMLAYPRIVSTRQRNAHLLSQLLADIPWIQTPVELPKRKHVWHQYTILISQDAPIGRDDLAKHLARRGIGTGVYYPRLVHEYRIFQGHPRVFKSETPIASDVSRRCLSLPIHPGVAPQEIEVISQVLHEVRP